MEHRPRAATMTPPIGTPIVAAPSWFALEPDPAAAKTARDETGKLLAGDAVADDVVSVVVELVTNAVKHAPDDYVVPLGVDPRIYLSLLPQCRWVLVAVRDPWPGIPRRREVADDDEHGRGLNIVHQLAAAWWTHFGTLDKTVYALVLRRNCELRPGELERLRKP